MRRGDFSELLGSNPFFSSPQIIRDPTTGQPFPGNIIPSGMLSPNGTGLMKLYPEPTPGFQQGTANAIFNSENPQDQRKDSIRLRLPAEQQQPDHVPLSTIELEGHRCVPRNLPSGPHRMGTAESDRDLQLDQHHQGQPDQRLQLLALARRGVHRRVHREWPAQPNPRRASTTRISSRSGRSSRTRYRRSTCKTSAGWTVVRIQRPRRGRFTPSRTPRPS